MPFYDDLLRHGDRLAVVSDDGQCLSYRQLDHLADKIAAPLSSRCLLFMLCSNSIGSLAGYVGFLKRRVVPLLLDASLDRELLFQLIATYKPQFLYVPYRDKENFPQYMPVDEGHGYVLLRAEQHMPIMLYEQLALLLTTSGSTGSPKLVRQSYRNIDSNASAIVEYLSIDADERPITTLPMHYTYGLSVINSHLLAGATLLLTDKTLMEKVFWKFLKEQSATSIAGVPYTYEMLKRLRFFKMELPFLKTMTQAGGKLMPELAREFAEYASESGKRFVTMYGQTEATARMSYLPHQFALSKYGSIGIAIPGGCFSLVDDHGDTVTASDTVGELVYRGENVTLGYAEHPEDLARGDERNGVLYTGDMAKRDADGFYTITGRKKRFIKLYGNRINLDEAEQLIKMIAPDCACAGTDDHMTIYITDREYEHEVRKFISLKTGINPIAFEVKVISQIPKNSSGKTEYTKL